MTSKWGSKRHSLRALRGRGPVVWRTFFVPSELINATGACALAPERVISALSMNPDRNLSKYINAAENAGHDRKICSFVKGLHGITQAGVLKQPNMLIASPNYCGAMPAAMREIAACIKRPFTYVNIPQAPCNVEDMAYASDQMRTIGIQLCSIMNLDHSHYEEELLPRAMELSNAAAAEWVRIQHIRSIRPEICEQPAAMDLALGLSDDWGTQALLRFMTTWRSDLESRMQTSAYDGCESLRLYWLHLRPYFTNRVFELLRAHSAWIVSEGVNTVTWEPLDPNAPYQSLAKKAVQASEISFYGVRYKRFVMESIERDRIDGVIYFFHENCQWAEQTFPAIYEHLSGTSSTRHPLLALHAECLIPSAQDAMQTRLSAFLQGLQQAKGFRLGSQRAGVSRTTRRVTPVEDVFIGVDAGSTFVKVVGIDPRGNVVALAKRRIGADIRRSIRVCLAMALEKAGLARDWTSLIATGVSQDSVDIADERLSEVLCHTKAIRELLPDVCAIIEVGGQDSKGITLSTSTATLNDRCAAGIGTFLTDFGQMLRLARLERLHLYNAADAALEFPTLCKAIIETEVRHAVGRGEPLASIVKGFYDALARIVLSSVGARIPSDAKAVALCGGAAMDPAFVQAIQKALGYPTPKVQVPERPIYTGALGAALFARSFLRRDEMPTSKQC